MSSPITVSSSANDTPSKLHPALWVAAISITAFSFAGIAHLAGWLPSTSKDSTKLPEATVVAATPATTTANTPVTPMVTVNQTVTVPPSPAPIKPLEARVSKVEAPAHHTKPATSKPAKTTAPAIVTASPPSDPAVRPAPPAPLVCNECGSIETIREIPVEGEGSGLGAVAGGLVGGVVGNQVGAGRGRELARVAGIVGGAFAGHQIEKNQHKTLRYEIVVRFEDGTSGLYKQDQAPSWRLGDRVKIVNGVITSNGGSAGGNVFTPTSNTTY